MDKELIPYHWEVDGTVYYFAPEPMKKRLHVLLSKFPGKQVVLMPMTMAIAMWYARKHLKASPKSPYRT